MKNILCILFYLFTLSTFSQEEASTWYFGQNAGLKFLSDGTVLPLSNGLLTTEEGCSVISDTNGNLLFYTDGRTVWDRNHLVMPNGNYFGGTGLYGDISSTQSGIIIPKPGSSNLYYIFTVDEPHHENAAVYPNAFSGSYIEPGSGDVPSMDDGKNNGLNYSVVDLSITGNNGSIGNVTTRNVHLTTYNTTPNGAEIKYKCSEKITAVKNELDNTYWVITHFTDKFYAFRIDENGVSSFPIVSNIGSNQQVSGYRRNAIGYLKASPNGKKIAIAHQQNGNQTGQASHGTGSIELFDFDIQTGIVSNYLPILPNVQAYGVEFSPSSEKLYTTYRIGTTPTMELAQFDLSQPNPETTKQLIFDGVNYLFALQLAPNNKIYCATGYQNSLGVIANPNNTGVSCNYTQVGQILSPNKNVQLGLPPFITSFFNATIQVENNCLGEITNFSLSSNQSLTSVYWDFGDGTTSTLFNPTHLYTASGTYMVTLQANSSIGSNMHSKTITIFEKPTANQIAPQTICTSSTTYLLSENNTTLLGTQNSELFGVSYYSSIQNAIENTNQLPITYNLSSGVNTFVAKVYTIQNPTCFEIQSFDVYWYQQPTANVISDFVICQDIPYSGIASFNLNLKNSEVLYGQNPNDFGVSYHLNIEDANSGTNPIISPYSNTSSSQTIYVRVYNLIHFSCYATTSVLLKVVKKAQISSVTNWSKCDDINNDGIGTFDLYLKDVEILNGQSAEDFQVSYHATLEDSILNLNALPQNFNTTSNPQTIYVRISNLLDLSCFSLTSFMLEIFQRPQLELQEEYSICEGNSIQINAPSGFDAYLWSNGETTSTTVITQSGDYQLTAFQNHGDLICDTTTHFTVYNSTIATISQLLISDWTMNNNTIQVLVLGEGNYSYSLDGIHYQDSPIFNAIPPGDYTVYVKDSYNCGIAEQNVSLLMYPYFFTPNGDGYNDFWQIYQGDKEPTLEVTIFDRYGKLLKVFYGGSQGWDGKFNNTLLPSSDYWFVVKRENGKVYKGHFSLKR
jgi:gliding motility-associated-like protein